jgi:hypothetical protein
VATILDGAHSKNDVVESVGQEIEAGRAGNERVLRLQDEDLNAERVTGDILLRLRDQALLVA